MHEVCFLLSNDRILRAYIGTATTIPDSRERWDDIWRYREEITEIAHTHPGESLAFSQEDLTTIEAVEAGLGKSLSWSVITRNGYRKSQDGRDQPNPEPPWWLPIIRELSFNTKTQKLSF